MSPLLASLALASAVASPPTECVRYVQPLTPAAKRVEADRIVRLSKVPTTAHDVQLIMASGAWHLVWATPVDEEEGIWFLRRTPQGDHLIDIWGGVFSDDADRADAVAWAIKVGVPVPLARCFAAVGI